MGEWTLTTFLHMGAAALWVGSMGVYAFLITPYAKIRFDEEEYIEFLNEIGLRFRRLGWISLTIITITGIKLADIISGWEAFTSAYGHSVPPASTIAWKMVLGFILLLLVAYHDFRVGPKAIVAYRLDPQSEETLRLRRRAVGFARKMMIISIIIFYLGVSVLRG